MKYCNTYDVNDFEDGFGNPIVFDFGSHSTKWGLFSQKTPFIQHSVLGIEYEGSSENPIIPQNNNETKVNTYYPFVDSKEEGIQYHIINNEINLEKMNDVVSVFDDTGLVNNFHHFETFVDELVSRNRKELGIRSDIETFWKTTPVDIIGGLYDPKMERERKVSLFFEKYEIPNFHFSEAGTSSSNYTFMESGGTYGKDEVIITVDIGHSNTRITPIIEGLAMVPIAKYVAIGSKDISTEILLSHFFPSSSSDGNINTSSKMSSSNVDLFRKQIFADNIKRKYCYFSMNYEFEKRCAENQWTSLFDLYKPLFHFFPVEIIYMFHQFAYGTNTKIYREKRIEDNVILKKEQFEGPELYFKPNQEIISLKKTRFGSDKKTSGLINDLHEMIEKVKKLESTLEIGRIIFCGGGTVVKNFEKRMKLEILNNDPKRQQKLHDSLFFPKDREIIAWMGSRSMIQFDGVRGMFYSKAEYDDSGTSIIHRKGFC